MSKGVKITILIVAALLAALFITMLFLCVPMGSKPVVLPITAFYLTGLVVAVISFVGGALSLFYRFRRLTRAGRKYYDNRNSIDKVDK